MPVNTPHPEYMKRIDQWCKCRDAVEGEDSIKHGQERYLPRLEDQNNTHYEAYLKRALFYSASGRTVKGLTGAVMRKPPEVTDVKDEILDNLGKQGESLDELGTKVIEELCITGRMGLLVDAGSENDSESYVAMYWPENIISWELGIRGGIHTTVRIVLREEVEVSDVNDVFTIRCVEQFRVLLLGQLDESQGDVYSVQIWQKKEDKGVKEGEEEYEIVEQFVPKMRGGRTIDFIPFALQNIFDADWDTAPPPIVDLVNVNLSHYMNSADLEHGLHFTALPTAYAAGFDLKGTNQLKIGSQTAWVTDNENAKAGYLEFTGQGLGAIRDQMQAKEAMMAVLGARMLEEQKKVAEAAKTVELRQAGEQSVLSNIAQAASHVLTRALRWKIMWDQGGGINEKIEVEMNQDFNLHHLDYQTLSTLFAMLQGGGISWDTWFYNLKRGEIVPDARTSEEEKDMITVDERSGMPGTVLSPGQEEPASEQQPGVVQPPAAGASA